jgi:hypothetical protein
MELAEVILRDNVFEHVSVEEDQGAERLALGRGGEAEVEDEVVEEGLDLGRAEL